MRTTTLIRTMTMAAAIAGFAGTTMADGPYFRSVTSGQWTAKSTWEQSPNGSSSWSGANVPPAAGDYVEIQNSDTVTVNANSAAATLTVDGSAALVVSSAKILTLSGGTSHIYGVVTVNNGGGEIDLNSAGSDSLVVESGGTLSVANGGIVSVFGSAPSLVVIGTLTLDGTMELGSSSGTPYLEVQSSQMIPNSSTGEIKGLASAAAQPEVRINANAAANTLTSAGKISGKLTVKGINTGSNNAAFVNQGTVKANVAGSLIFHSSLASVGDNNTSAAAWQVATSNSAVLQFDRGSANFAGTFSMLVSGGVMNVNSTISSSSPADPLVYNNGTINVASGVNFYFSSYTGTCGGASPGSPMTNTTFARCP